MKAMQEFLEKFKINVPVRFKNIYFWVGVVGTMLSAVNVKVEDLTTWQAVGDMFVTFFNSPVQIIGVTMALIGVFADPTTQGLGDSKQALEYKYPKKKINNIDNSEGDD